MRREVFVCCSDCLRHEMESTSARYTGSTINFSYHKVLTPGGSEFIFIVPKTGRRLHEKIGGMELTGWKCCDHVQLSDDDLWWLNSRVRLKELPEAE